MNDETFVVKMPDAPKPEDLSMLAGRVFEEPMPTQIRVKLLRPEAKLPARAHDDDAGWDVFACMDEAVTLSGGDHRAIPLGIALEIPRGWKAQVFPRSGLAFNHGIMAHVGTIDAGYRGEVKAKLFNLDGWPLVIRPGDRVAQLCFSRCPEVTLVQAEELGESERGGGGFGSSGR